MKGEFNLEIRATSGKFINFEKRNSAGQRMQTGNLIRSFLNKHHHKNITQNSRNLNTVEA